MNEITYIFKRIEEKYILSAEQYRTVFARISPYLLPDEYGKSTILSLYLDTPDHRIIRNSIEAKNYKEKLRVRSYGTAKPDGKVYFEIKKKFDKVTYKRRVGMRTGEAEVYLKEHTAPFGSQIMSEFNYTMGYYGWPQPAALISCEREAYFVEGAPALRLTFDASVRYRDWDMALTRGSEGRLLLPQDSVLMEFKTDGAMPLWLSSALGEVEAYPGSFSKYGMAYRDMLARSGQEIPGGAPSCSDILISKGDYSYA